MTAIYIILNVMLLWFGLQNANSVSGKMVFAGEISNSIAIAANGFKMPAYGYFSDDMHETVTPHTNLLFLTDDIFISVGSPQFTISISVGDIMILTGSILGLLGN